MARHKWDKVIYSGKYSSFEKRANCTVCGCEREKLMYGYVYKTANGERHHKAPECAGKIKNDLTDEPSHEEPN